MTVNNLEDIEQLIMPLEGENPCGQDLREDSSPTSPYYTLKDIRNAARRKEREYTSEDIDELGSNIADWLPILEQVPDILKTKTKDLEVVAWYIEALLRRYGFEGLAYGFQLVTKLLETYQVSLYPQDEDGIETTLLPLIGLNGIDSDGALITPIASVPLFVGQSGIYATWHHEQAVDMELLTDARIKAKRIKTGAVTLEQIKDGVKECDRQKLKQTFRGLKGAILAFAELEAQFDSLAPGMVVPTSKIKNRLKSCESVILELAKHIVIEKGALKDAAGIEEESEQVLPVDGLGSTAPGELNRSRALEMLSMIADYFRESEPHSPISYSLEQAVRWSEMDLPELLDELIPDKTARQQYHKFTGIPKLEK